MSYSDALSYLGGARRFGMKLGLDQMQELARGLGDPQEKLRFIHIAGTNGKGSTAAFCESILRAAGFRVGLYTSPHLVSVRERVQINRTPISEADFGEGMAAVREAAQKVGEDDATFFELITALALWYFAREQVEWVVWETGLGGRLDATNIVTPEVCVITNIGLEHQQHLGDSPAKIAAEKAGIIKPGVPLVTGVEEGEAFDVIWRRADELKAPLTLVHRDLMIEDLGMHGGRQLARIDGRDHTLGLIGRHQVANAACAMAGIRNVLLRDDDAIACGLAEATWPGRFEIISERPLVVLDGAHNAAATKMLVKTWRSFLSARLGWSAERIDGSTDIVFGAVADKDISEMAEILRPIAKEVSLVRLGNERSADPAVLAESFSGLPTARYNSVTEAWSKIVSTPESIFLITGSLFLVGEMLARRSGNTGEYLLNERLEKSTAFR
jgi:dihydrofolate synthase/folylpolyglutamate synthase